MTPALTPDPDPAPDSGSEATPSPPPHLPPWSAWSGRHRPPGPPPHWSRQRRFFFRRFLAFFLLSGLTFTLALAGLAYLLVRLAGGDAALTPVVWLAGCGMAFTLPLLAAALAYRSFRRFADPLAQLMAAADAVAAGDLSVRLAESGPRELRRLSAAFNRMTAELEQSDQRRRSMAADVAHELRTPLHILQGNLEGIQDGVYPASPEQIDLLLDETRQLARLVEDLRLLSLAEAGQLPFEMAPLELADLLAETAAAFDPAAAAAGVELRLAIDPPAAGLVLTADAGRLQQALGNLVSNALRHTPPGGAVTLRLTALPGGGARLQVSDTGAGIPPADLPYLFERFWRGDPARTRGPLSGSGLGLPIARQLVQAHGGRISVESVLAAGTTFTVDLPG